MNVPLHIGFTGTRYGMTVEQRSTAREIIVSLWRESCHPVLHHGDCIGADAQFHDIGRRMSLPVSIVVHPGPDDGQHRAHCLGYDAILPPMPHMRRNAEIVAASHVMIAAPFEDEPQPRGGTWATIRMALRALRRAKLRDLYAIGRGGDRLEHGAWKP